jgi:putative tricarboxylic transport membrane protein
LPRDPRRMHGTPAWEEALERNGWNDFFKPGDEFTAFLEDENARVDRIIADLGLGG